MFYLLLAGTVILIYLVYKMRQEIIFSKSLLESVLSNQRTITEKLEYLENYDFLPREEKDSRRFQNAEVVTLSTFEWLSGSEGQTLSLISQSHFYPSIEAYYKDFEYKDASFGETIEVNGKKYVAVNGFERDSPYKTWSPCTLYASKDSCATGTFEGSVRRLPYKLP